jgi:hypothetical protein
MIATAKKLGRGQGYRALNLHGLEFGRLRAIKPLPERNNGGIVWLCACQCGNRCRVRAGLLTSGDRVSCGCALTEYRYLRRRIAAYCRRNMTIVEIWQSGVTMTAIARHFGTNHQRVSKIVRRYIREMLRDRALIEVAK